MLCGNGAWPLSSKPGALVLSLDFELHWGVRDHARPVSPYARNLLGARAAIPRILELLESFEIAATWAVVGFLFAHDRAELEATRPNVRPRYTDGNLDPYSESVGWDEAADPFHYAPSLIQLIRRTPYQEIGTHTWSHYYCTERGQTTDSFQADLASALAIHTANGLPIRSIVFPRNQHNPEYDQILREAGIAAYRGNPDTTLWRTTAASGTTRIARLLDAYFPFDGDGTYSWNDVKVDNGLANVRASRFLRPWSSAGLAFEHRRMNRITDGLAAAAERGRLYHLWWHPHNFGRHLDQNLGVLRHILEQFAKLRERTGMLSLNMYDTATMALTSNRIREPECAFST